MDKEDFESSETATGGSKAEAVKDFEEDVLEYNLQAEAGRQQAARRGSIDSILSDYGVSEDDKEEAARKVDEYMRQYGMTREQAADLVNLDYIAETGFDLGGQAGYGISDLEESTSAAQSFLGGLGTAARGQASGAVQQTAESLQGSLGMAKEAGKAQITKDRRRAAAGAARQAKIFGSVQKAQIDRLKAQEQSVAGTVFGGIFGAVVGAALIPILGAAAAPAAKALLVAGASKLGGDVGGSI